MKTQNRAWLCLLTAGMTEIIWAYGLKMTEGFTVLWWSVFTVAFMLVSFLLFARAMKEIPVGTAYAVFTGIGAAGTAVVGMAFLGEPATLFTILSLVVLISGIIGLKLTGGKEEEVDRC